MSQANVFFMVMDLTILIAWMATIAYVYIGHRRRDEKAKVQADER